MARGPRAKRLTDEQVRRFKKLQNALHRFMPEMAKTMDCPFNWRTLQRAIDGEPVSILNHTYIVGWLDKHVPGDPEPVAAVDGKMHAAGDRE